MIELVSAQRHSLTKRVKPWDHRSWWTGRVKTLQSTCRSLSLPTKSLLLSFRLLDILPMGSRNSFTCFNSFIYMYYLIMSLMASRAANFVYLTLDFFLIFLPLISESLLDFLLCCNFSPLFAGLEGILDSFVCELLIFLGL